MRVRPAHDRCAGQQAADRVGADVLGGPNLLTEGDIAVIREELARARPSMTRSKSCGPT